MADMFNKVVGLLSAAALGAASVLAYPMIKRLGAKPLRVLITGAAGQIGYALAPMVARGVMLGADVPVVLHLLDQPSAEEALKGLEMELIDSAYPLLQGIVTTTELTKAFTDVDIVIMVAGFPRKTGMERKDVMAKNVSIYKEQAPILEKLASKDVKVVVVANPANTNALILKENAPSIPPENITCLTQLDHNRALGQVAEHIPCHVSEVKNVIIWGNHSSTQFPDVNHGTVMGAPIREVVENDDYWDKQFITNVRNRGAAIIKARNFSSALSAASAICDHVSVWIHGTPRGEWVSMGVISDGSYGVPEGLMYSFPVTCSRGRWNIVQGLEIDNFSQGKMKETADELVNERAMAMECLASGH
eukprot:evm.model.scf_2134EXC.2 EVM.evm.TU.scf_2134EXC.2   scf_2134EXC:4774-9585(-)